VYAVRGRECAGPGGGAEGKPIDGVMNVGLRPTFAGTHVSLEVHFFDLAAGSDLYGRRLHLDVVGRLRGEQRFPDVGALKAQIEADCRAARAVLAAGR
jgi:riboflavin kinase/FMN adenylyltransferase